MSGLGMRQALRHRQAQVQALRLSPSIYQAIEILGLSQEELDEHLQSLALDNPFIALAPRYSGTVAAPADALPPIEDTVPGRVGLRQTLHQELALSPAAPAVKRRVAGLIEHVDDRGYLCSPDDFSPDTVRTDADALQVLQSLAAAGIGARDLQECLLLQLQASGIVCPAWLALLDNLGAIERRDFPALEKACQKPADVIAEMLRMLQSLDPHPGRAFDDSALLARIPDMKVRQGPSGEWSVEAVGDPGTGLTVDTGLAEQFRKSRLSEADKAYIDAQLDQADWLQAAVRRRSDTLMKVVMAICARQHEALTRGLEHIRPLTMKALADLLEMHESTICRCVSGKSIDTPIGLIPLRAFFAASVETDTGDALSNTAIAHQIKILIEAEPPHDCVTDRDLSEILNGRGIRIARRTISKYREKLGIPAANQRRRQARFDARLDS